MGNRPSGGGRVSYGLRAPSPRTPKYDVLEVTSTAWTDVVILTPQLYGVEVYWDGERTQPVTDDARSDRRTYAKLVNKHWQGWLAVRRYRQATVYLCRITPVTVACVPLLDDPAHDLRGWCIGLCRESNDKRAKLKGRWNNVRADLVNLPHPPDVPAQLERMWDAPMREQCDGDRRRDADQARHLRSMARQVASELEVPT